jgi:hypothetical protein
MPDWIKKELRSNFARASRAGRLAAITAPRAARVTYRTQKHALHIELTNGATITLPVKLIPSLNGARPKDLRTVEVLGRGSGLHWEGLDLDMSVPGLVCSAFPGHVWLAELGRQGGRQPRLPKRSLHAETAVRAVARAFDRRRAQWNLDASPPGYYFMTTLIVNTEIADGRH